MIYGVDDFLETYPESTISADGIVDALMRAYAKLLERAEQQHVTSPYLRSIDYGALKEPGDPTVDTIQRWCLSWDNALTILPVEMGNIVPETNVLHDASRDFETLAQENSTTITHIKRHVFEEYSARNNSLNWQTYAQKIVGKRSFPQLKTLCIRYISRNGGHI